MLTWYLLTLRITTVGSTLKPFYRITTVASTLKPIYRITTFASTLKPFDRITTFASTFKPDIYLQNNQLSLTSPSFLVACTLLL